MSAAGGLDRVRAALYLDFDNVFTGLIRQDPDVAMQFAEDPGGWASQLATALPVNGPRRWLILRCYMNPSGWVPHPDADSGTPRLYFSKFRPFFTNAGFEVIDCPRLTHTKNAADIRIVVDALDALHDTACDEFVILSGDSDMTPLLVRLRRADRRTTVVSPLDAAEAFTSVADRLIGSEQLLELIQGEPVEADDDASAPEPTDHAGLAPVDAEKPSLEADEAMRRFADIVSGRYAATTAPINLAGFAAELRRTLGSIVDETNWFGHGGFVRTLESLDLPGAMFSQHFLWHADRHVAPASAQAAGPGVDLPEPVARLSKLLGIPRLSSETWSSIYPVLAEYASNHRFNLTEATRWSRDRLAAEGVDVRRNALAFVVRGATFGGCPLYRQPPPNDQEIRDAFVNNVLSRADAADVSLTDDETTAVRTWFAPPA
ncbi:NYN domain-containing protein [Asanoa ferruginea]|uniref:NYN domain-containing protein n=1 Tax=Asanoa ferruginea TaxID=53367 RepID=A0A3D9ZD76_9ACTN|nr:NYN domain-containing protein [Asanoa ferruginea]REF95225.1 NYN domain-containing protein [Asanoa ferruginea]GIF53474.1 NYN domain-containing protein [Asanoa ferruginea]